MIYIASPTGIATGGTELLQQLCFCLINNGIPAKMLYYGEFIDSPVSIKFSEYHNPYVLRKDFKSNAGDVLVVPETSIGLLYKESSALKKYVWWLSVDNYFAHDPKGLKMKLRAALDRMAFKRCSHLVQSEYARLFLKDNLHITDQKVYYVSDYLNEEYDCESIDYSKMNRKDNILYNPRKGFETTLKIKAEIGEYNWLPLQGYTNQQLRDLFCTSKVYIDFGEHPGKDRIPREAAVCGCCVITGKKGAAGNDIDVPIPSEYKFDDSQLNVTAVHQKITECMNDYDERIKQFFDYISMIKSERRRFEKDVCTVFKRNQ